jgi:hypothetical protein
MGGHWLAGESCVKMGTALTEKPVNKAANISNKTMG